MQSLSSSSLRFELPKPCYLPEDQFTPAGHGDFCKKCQKVVVDFSEMSDEEVHRYIAVNGKPECGQFRLNQLQFQKGVGEEMEDRKTFSWRWVIVFLMMFVTVKINSTNYVPNQKTKTVETILEETLTRKVRIKGTVYKDNRRNRAVRHATVSIDGINQTVFTNLRGQFELEVEIPDTSRYIILNINHNKWGETSSEVEIESDSITETFFFYRVMRGALF
jgi:hypothetical protein